AQIRRDTVTMPPTNISRFDVQDLAGLSAPAFTNFFTAGAPNQGSSPSLTIGSTLANMTSGYSNVGYGGGWHVGVPTTGNLGQITTGHDNVAIGAGVMNALQTGNSNVAVG